MGLTIGQGYIARWVLDKLYPVNAGAAKVGRNALGEAGEVGGKAAELAKTPGEVVDATRDAVAVAVPVDAPKQGWGLDFVRKNRGATGAMVAVGAVGVGGATAAGVLAGKLKKEKRRRGDPDKPSEGGAQGSGETPGPFAPSPPLSVSDPRVQIALGVAIVAALALLAR